MIKIIIAVCILGATGLIGGALLSVVSAICDKGDKNERLEKIRDALPGANCGACGFAGCDSYAEAVDKGEAEPNLCAPGGANSAKALSEILGVEVDTSPKMAKVLCAGCTEKVDTKYNYSGMKSCAAAASLGAGPSGCDYGCIGFGDCVNACPFNAIVVENSLASVNADICTGCGKCAKVCPKQIISIVPKKQSATVKCSNKQKGAAAKKICSAACIGCSLCAKACETGAITVENFLAHIDEEKCSACGKCADACPQKIIVIK